MFNSSLMTSVIASAALLASAQALDDEDYSTVFQRKLLLSVEVTRHGERQPHYIYPFAADPT